MPERIQLRRTRGWRMPPNTLSVARPGKFGNPFTKAAAIESGYATEETWRPFVIRCFREWLDSDCDWWQGPESDARKAAILAAIPDLRGKNIGCWCSEGEPCHGDVYIEMANQ